MRSAWICLVALGAAAGSGMASGCGSSPPATTFFSREEMLQPEKCAGCHMDHFNDWSVSMHAKAADDPVFIAMNKRGQRETKGTLGTFCVQCHAPMAVRDKMTTNGLNLASLPQYYKGVTCFFCHSIDSVGGAHDNASVNLATDLVMRGELSNPPPVANSAHASTYSSLHDDKQKDSSTMCGSCHDIDSMAGGHIERTFAEWNASAYSGPKGLTCSGGGCHMTAALGMVPVATGGPARKFHAHNFPAVDVPLNASESIADGIGTMTEGGAATDAEAVTEGGAATDAGAVTDAGIATAEGGPASTAAVENALNNNALVGALCVTAANGIRVILDTIGIGHQWPSGAAQDRRAWAEVMAFGPNPGDTYSSGVVPDGTSVTSTAATDPDLWLLRDCMFNAQSQPVVNFWEAASTSGYELPALATFDPSTQAFFLNHIVQSFPRATVGKGVLPFKPVRVTLRIRIQPVGLDVLNDLVQSKDLDPAIVASMPTFDVSLQGPTGVGLAIPGGLEWTPASNDGSYKDNVDSQGKTTCVASPGFIPGGTLIPGGSAAVCTAK
jgi:hypothetical protein